ncbi:unnamed protein product [Adineta steineri]|uniref:F-box domain-containing protein n=1 Tax=Adineta steineri TaxID=433720 RepID=A0A819JRF3_9BILA|nr:unnamed protein product [Adineta steineri]CAF3937308.1 unnamed protein product [Adineta steineri]
MSDEEQKNMLETSKQNNMSYTHIEDLSNEIFYEIFEFIDYYDLYNAFSNLNNRFQNLFNYPYLSLSTNIEHTSASEVEKYYTQFITPNKHRIVSLYFNDRLYINNSQSSYIIDSSFNRLQSLNFNRVQHKQFLSLLPTLMSLPHLSSIIVHFNDNIVNLTEIYRLIFQLPFLNKLELLAKGYSLTMSLPLNELEQHSHIKHLIINHACSLTELINLLSYTPLLVHLTCMELCKQDQYIEKITSLKIFNLTSITFHMCNVEFSNLEIFIQNIGKQLRVLCINTSQDIAYMNATRWEQLISMYIPNLRVLKFGYDEYHYQNIELASHHTLLNQFTSSFWINRGWFFQITVDIDYWPPIKVTYSISPNRPSWCHMYEETDNIKLTVDRLYFAASREYLVDKIFSFISTFHITHLTIDCEKFAYIKFIQLLSMLPNLNSLKIMSLSYFKLKCAVNQSCLMNNKIITLEFQSFIENIDLEKIQFFIDLCPHMKYLQVKCEHTFNIESILRYILLKNNTKFNFFCLWVPITNDIMIKQLQIMINHEKLLIQHYEIKRTTDKIYLQWNN